MFEWVARFVAAAACFAAISLFSPHARAEGGDGFVQRRWELSGLAEALFISTHHGFSESGYGHARFELPVVLLGARFGYFPLRYLGGEAEGAVGSGGGAGNGGSDDIRLPFFASAAGHVIGQLPWKGFVPFVLVGAGVLNVSTTATGRDADFMLRAGVGAKLFVTRRMAPRLDLRLALTQNKSGRFRDGVAAHAEVVWSVAFDFGPRPPGR